jgi:PhoD-like phosphatase
MADLVLGPLLRYVSDTEATIWVETDAACEVSVLGRSQRTFEVAGHHYALVCLDGFEPGEVREYEVELDGVAVWPPPDALGPSCVSTFDPEGKIDLVFGSCRVTVPHERPYTLTKDEHEDGREVDALHVLGKQMLRGQRDDFPEVILMLGDQVYADEVPPAVRDFIAQRRGDRSGDDEAPLEEVADFEEYTRLYYEAWCEPVTRWLLSTVSTSMIFDDHDMHDDWNISQSWVEDSRKVPWWQERILGGFVSYWVYQHIGNLSPDELSKDDVYQAVLAADGDVAPLLREYSAKADSEPAGARWSIYRDIGRTRVLVIDSRAARVLEPGSRQMLDDAEWEWLVEHATGDFDHLIIGTSLPWLMGHGMHFLEAWSERVCDGAWGGPFSKLGERIRRGLDLEHWAAFESSFNALTRLLEEVGSGRRGKPPASIVVLSGDVHHAYLADVAFRRSAGVRSHVYQAVCSPMRNPLSTNEKRAIRAAASRYGQVVFRGLARLAGVPDPPVRWRFAEGPLFNNQIATLKLRGRQSVLRLDKTAPHDEEGLRFELTFERALTERAEASDLIKT